MRALPTQQLNPKVKNVWRINDSIWITLSFGCLIALVALLSLDSDISSAAGPILSVVLLVLVICWVAALIVWLVVLPPIRYVRWRYELNDEYLDIARGIFWRKRFVIPFIRIQNTDTRQGPLQRLFGLASVTASTAAGEHSIPGLDVATAEAVRDKAAELARLAREDV